jgi:septal ring factor EnvC (AmiA/AmiB activator)
MNRTEFIIAITIILIIAFALGWFANWLVHRLTRVSDADVNELESLAASLHEAEELRDQAITYIEQRESELTTQLSQTEAELRAAMEGLRDARSENDHLRSKLEKS